MLHSLLEADLEALLICSELQWWSSSIRARHIGFIRKKASVCLRLMETTMHINERHNQVSS